MKIVYKNSAVTVLNKITRPLRAIIKSTPRSAENFQIRSLQITPGGLNIA